MKATLLSIGPTQAALNAGRPVLTPEILAVTGAKYSRSNLGLEQVLTSNEVEGSVERILEKIDYGHQSIADMSEAAVCMDGVSQYLVYLMWSQCQVVGGQESSTRFIKMSREGLVDPKLLGIPDRLIKQWEENNDAAFGAYHKALELWEKRVSSNEKVARIPTELLEQQKANNKKATKQVVRMLRNYGFDRSRYFIPLGTRTNVMMKMSAREWAKLCRYLQSHALPEAKKLGQLLISELELAIPAFLRHGSYNKLTEDLFWDEFDEYRDLSLDSQEISERQATAFLEIYPPNNVTAEDIAKALAQHRNRYDPFGKAIQRTPVRYGWGAVSLGEIRDLNRHRTGSKYCPQAPLGFYCALDQCLDDPEMTEAIQTLQQVGVKASQMASELLRAGDPTYVYWLLLGTQFSFEHTTTADKYIYTAELRTGIGAHYRYADHFHESLLLWYKKYPDTRSLISEGNAEPE